MASPPSQKNDQQEAEFTRKMVLGLLSTLQTKGLLSQGEIDSILRAARQASLPTPPTRPAGPALPGTRWVNAEGQPLGMDRTTPLAIPDVKPVAPAPEADRPPVIDMTLD